MGKPLSTDLRSRLVRAVAEGMTRRAAAARFGVSAASAVRWVQAVTMTGTVEPKPQGGDTRSHRVDAFISVILAAIEDQKDTTLVELAALLRAGHGVSVSASTVGRCLNRHAISYKKNSARGRAGAPRRRDPSPGLVRRPA